MTTQNTNSRREKITSHAIGPTLFELTLPMLFALLAIMGLGLIDSYFIAFLGTEELAAIGFIMPITFIVSSVSLGLGMAISSLTSKLIGANKMQNAARLITDGFYLTALCAVVIVVLLIWQLENVFQLIGADKQTLPHIVDYMHVWFYGTALVMFTQVCSSTFRSIGDTKTSAVIALSMTVVNLILDPLLIFGIGPFPAMGMQGAALATVLAVLVSCAIAFFQLGLRERLLLLSLPRLAEFKSNISQLVEIAAPAIVANVIVPLTGAILITLVAEFGTDAVAGFGVGSRIEAISLLVVYALSATLPMFIGQNLGADKPERVLAAIKLAFKFVLLFQLGIYLILAIVAQPIAHLFSDVESVQNTIIWFILIVPISYGLSGIVILVNVSMNVLGRPRIALYINLIRLCLFYLPLAYLGAHLFDIKGLFIGITLGNVCAFILAASLLNRVLGALNIRRA